MAPQFAHSSPNCQSALRTGMQLGCYFRRKALVVGPSWQIVPELCHLPRVRSYSRAKWCKGIVSIGVNRMRDRSPLRWIGRVIGGIFGALMGYVVGMEQAGTLGAIGGLLIGIPVGAILGTYGIYLLAAALVLVLAPLLWQDSVCTYWSWLFRTCSGGTIRRPSHRVIGWGCSSKCAGAFF
jgi:hypothetical protein